MKTILLSFIDYFEHIITVLKVCRYIGTSRENSGIAGAIGDTSFSSPAIIH